MDKQSIAYNLKQIVKKSGLKQYVVAEKCGYSPKTFNNLLNGRKVINEEDILKICNGIGVTPDKLFGFEKIA